MQILKLRRFHLGFPAVEEMSYCFFCVAIIISGTCSLLPPDCILANADLGAEPHLKP